jgi:hypothetical protein
VNAANVSMQQETSEAINSGLYQNAFTALGESDGGRVQWWTRGIAPKNIRIAVEMSQFSPTITVTIEWRNLSGHSPVKGTKRLTLKCSNTDNADEIKESTTTVVLRCLEIYRDVIQGTGVASAAALEHLDFDTSTLPE